MRLSCFLSFFFILPLSRKLSRFVVVHCENFFFLSSICNDFSFHLVTLLFPFSFVPLFLSSFYYICSSFFFFTIHRFHYFLSIPPPAFYIFFNFRNCRCLFPSYSLTFSPLCFVPFHFTFTFSFFSHHELSLSLLFFIISSLFCFILHFIIFLSSFHFFIAILSPFFFVPNYLFFIPYACISLSCQFSNLFVALVPLAQCFFLCHPTYLPVMTPKINNAYIRLMSCAESEVCKIKKY